MKIPEDLCHSNALENEEGHLKINVTEAIVIPKMASGSHVDVNERRLRPIYDCLDNGNNKKAIQEAEKALKKHKYFQCAKVLKALALLRLGRHDESSLILDEIHSQHPTDEATLQVSY
jgi:N-terminal acetyltransferase B complex non-catalytic subunit